MLTFFCVSNLMSLRIAPTAFGFAVSVRIGQKKRKNVMAITAIDSEPT
jgi:hypothetical protein